MIKKSVLSILVVFFIQALLVSAFPIIDDITIKQAYPDLVQISWDIRDEEEGLAKIELFQDGELIHEKDIFGINNIDLYQVKDTGLLHSYELIIYNVNGISASKTQKYGGDYEAPVIDGESRLSSNTNEYEFKTDEPAICKIGLDSENLEKISSTFETEHSSFLPMNDGLNRIFIKCTDDKDNEMPGLYAVEFFLDKDAPGKVQTLTFKNVDDEVRIAWEAPNDDDDIDHYNVYNSLKKITSVDTQYWDVTTEDSVFFITVVDEAGNEGEKREYNVGRRIFLGDNEENETEEDEEEETEDKKVSSTSKIAWIVFAVLVVLFIAWRFYEHKSDRHGLRRYMSNRRRIRSFRSKFK